jgi:hypothetical protein
LCLVDKIGASVDFFLLLFIALGRPLLDTEQIINVQAQGKGKGWFLRLLIDVTRITVSVGRLDFVADGMDKLGVFICDSEGDEWVQSG